MSTIKNRLPLALFECKADKAKTLADVARVLRRLFAKSRRFSAPAYIAHSGSSLRIYCDAFAEVLEGRGPVKIATMCARYPMTKACKAAIDEANARWAEVFGVSV